MLEDEEIFHGFFRMNLEQFYCLSNWWEGKYENKTPTIGGRFHLKNDLQSFKVHAIKSVGDKKGILDAIKSVGDKKGIPDAIEATLFLN